jgi:LPS-assembly protein
MLPRSAVSCVLILPITLVALCHLFSVPRALAQLAPGAPPAAQAPAAPAANDELFLQADSQSTDGKVWRYLRGHVEVRKGQMVLTADEIDYNEETGDSQARGHVHFSYPVRKEDVYASRAEYNLNSEMGMFYEVHGTVSSASQGNIRILTTNEPFYFQGERAQKIEDHYIVYNGFVTDCKMPRPWWTLGSPRATIVPGQYALMHHTIFRLRKVPLFYTPVYYKSLERLPRQSGFLTPNIGNSSSRGFVLGESFFWAVNRSFDLTPGFTYFSARGLATHVTGRARPSPTSHFDFYFYAMNDRGIKQGSNLVKQGGETLSVNGRAELPLGFHGVINVDYLSSLQFRLAFSETLSEAIGSESHSIGFASKEVSDYFINLALIRDENFFTAEPGDTISIRKLPSIEFNSRDHQLVSGLFPVWLTFDSAADMLSRNQPGFHTAPVSERLDFFPRLSTKLEWKGFRFVPTFGADETYYGQSLRPDGTISGQDLLRSAREISVELAPPSLDRIFDGPKLFADHIKHVIEPKITYTYVTGVSHFDRLIQSGQGNLVSESSDKTSYMYVPGVSDLDRVIRFDERDLLTNTNQIEFSLVNRFLGKTDSNGEVRELASVEIAQRRYFDPTFGGALKPGARNEFLSTVDLTPFAFADSPRNYSPVVSVVRIQPRWNYTIEWRNDYDPLRGRFVNNGITADATVKNFGLSLGEYVVRSDPVLTPNSNQFRGAVRYGSLNKRGWSVGMNLVYDYRVGIMQYANSQVTYNTDCCGFSVEWRRFALGATRNENQFRLALSIANIGSFGNLKKQERVF